MIAYYTWKVISSGSVIALGGNLFPAGLYSRSRSALVGFDFLPIVLRSTAGGTDVDGYCCSSSLEDATDAVDDISCGNLRAALCEHDDVDGCCSWSAAADAVGCSTETAALTCCRCSRRSSSFTSIVVFATKTSWGSLLNFSWLLYFRWALTDFTADSMLRLLSAVSGV